VDSDGEVEAALYDVVGGQAFFDRLAARFYEGVRADEHLVALYPDRTPDGLAEAKRRLALFLGQYWGGPTTYSDERGHPRLRMRHAPFPIGPGERDRWLSAMRAAVEAEAPSQEVADALWGYFTMAADAMRNR
jgi:hemoglobin